jgi:hypothetical protein
MKKILLFSAILVLWAVTAMASEMPPPYSDVYSYSPFFVLESEQGENGIVMYPNPVTEGRLTIKSEESFHSIQILNITGEIVFSQQYPSGTTSEVLELAKLEKGMYLVRIGFAGKANHTGKIIVK